MRNICNGKAKQCTNNMSNILCDCFDGWSVSKDGENCKQDVKSLSSETEVLIIIAVVFFVVVIIVALSLVIILIMVNKKKKALSSSLEMREFVDGEINDEIKQKSESNIIKNENKIQDVDDECKLNVDIKRIDVEQSPSESAIVKHREVKVMKTFMD